MRARLPLRLARSAAFAVVCVTLAALGHWLADGAGARPSAVLVGGATVLVAAVALAGRERSPVAIGGFLVAAQVFLHELFASDAMGGGSLTLMAHGQGLSVSLGMIIAHLTATLITGWWLARGEAALWAMLRRVGMLVIGRLRLLLLLLGVQPVEPEHPFPRPRAPLASGRRLRHSVIRRGPPLLPAF